PDNNKAVMLMAHAGAGANVPADNLRLTFRDSASAPIPANGPLASQAYQPANYAPASLSLPPPAPAGPYATFLSSFDGLNPNGDWKLYILDDTYPDGGTIDPGWQLHMELKQGPMLSIDQNGSAFRIRFIGTANRTYGLQTTSDLRTWIEVGSVIAGADGAGEFDGNIDPAALASFFRVVVR